MTITVAMNLKFPFRLHRMYAVSVVFNYKGKPPFKYTCMVRLRMSYILKA